MKKPTYHCYGSPREYIRMLKYLNKPFTKQTTTSTRIIITENEKRVYCGESTFLSKREMILQRQLVKNINNNTEGENIIKNPKNKVKYFRFDDSVRRMSEYLGEIVSIKNVLEMDIVKAYYQVAHNLGYIDEDFYKKTLKLPKYIRLRLLGSIATRKIIEDFEGDQLISVKTKTNEKMRNIWFNICLKLDEIIKKHMTHPDREFPIADKEWLKLISLPVHPAMTEEDIDYVIYWVNQYFKENK